MLEDLSFYRNYYKYSGIDATKIKIEYLKSLIDKNKIYKFIAFDKNQDLNNVKLNCLKNDMLWFSHYIYLNDKTEFQIQYNRRQVSKVTGMHSKGISIFVEMMKELYDVCSFTYGYDSYMWDAYANKGNGICIVFEVHDYDMLYPVEYVEKQKIDYTAILIDAYSKTTRELLESGTPMAELPFVTKNPMNGLMESFKEKEIRILYEPYGDESLNGGFIKPKIKEEKEYRGKKVAYSDCKLSIDEIIIGNKCDKEIAKQIVEDCQKKKYNFRKIK